jgi:hypothetical protein
VIQIAAPGGRLLAYRTRGAAHRLGVQRAGQQAVAVELAEAQADAEADAMPKPRAPAI